MFLWFSNLSHVSQALIASLFTWSVTMLGAAIVFFFKEVQKGIMDALLGFSAGVMIAASFWSLLSPSIELANSLNMTAWIVAVTGFLAGGLLYSLVIRYLIIYLLKTVMRVLESLKDV